MKNIYMQPLRTLLCNNYAFWKALASRITIEQSRCKNMHLTKKQLVRNDYTDNWMLFWSRKFSWPYMIQQNQFVSNQRYKDCRNNSRSTFDIVRQPITRTIFSLVCEEWGKDYSKSRIYETIGYKRHFFVVPIVQIIANFFSYNSHRISATKFP